MTKHSIAASCALALAAFAFAPATFAGVGVDAKEPKVLKEVVKESCITGDIGVTVTNAYFSRGIRQEDKGVILQPYLDLYFKLYEGTGFLNKVTLSLSLWDSLHSEQTNANPGSGVSSWYESDYYVGLAFVFAKNFTLTESYFEFDYPNSNTDAQRSVNSNLAYDDTDLLGAFALHPHVAVLYNFDGVAGIAATDAWYFEFGIAPGFVIAKSSPYAVTVTFPLTVGLGNTHFYPTDRYGFFSAGATISVPLAFVPECYGKWSATASGLYLNLGDDTAALHRGDHDAGVASFTLALSF